MRRAWHLALGEQGRHLFGGDVGKADAAFDIANDRLDLDEGL